MIFDEPPTLFRLYWKPRGAGVVGWGWRDFGNPDERYDYLDQIRPVISKYAFDEGEDLVDPPMEGLPPESLEKRDA